MSTRLFVTSSVFSGDPKFHFGERYLRALLAFIGLMDATSIHFEAIRIRSETAADRLVRSRRAIARHRVEAEWRL